MANEDPEYKEIWMGLLGTDAADGYYPVVTPVNTLATATFPPKTSIGDYTKDSEDTISSLILSDFSGGINIEDMNEGSDTARCWTAFMDIRRPGKIALNLRVQQLSKPAAASGTAYSCGVMADVPYVIFGTKVYGLKESDLTWYTGVTTTLTPVEKPVRFAGKVFVPCGASGYLILSDSGVAGTPTVTPVTAGLLGFPAAYNPASLDRNPPKPVAFWVFDQRLWALSSSGALCWSFTGDDDTGNWPYDEARAWYPRIESGAIPQRIIGFYNPNGDPSLFITTDRGAFIYNWSIPSIIDTPVQFPPHPDFGGAVCVWRAGEDLHIANGLDSVRYTSANVVVPLNGLARDDGLPQELWGRILDLEPETSEMFAMVGPVASGGVGYLYSAQVGSAGTGNGQFADVRGIAVDASGNVWACDENNERVQTFNSSLVYQSQFGTAGTGNGQFATDNGPYDLALDSSANVWVVDRGNHRVQKFNSAGTYQSQFGSFDDGTPAVAGSETWTLQNTFGSLGSGNDNFNTPKQVAVDSSGNTYTADSLNSRVVKRNSSGVFQSSITPTGLAFPGGVTIDSSGNIYIVCANDKLVRKYNAAGVFQAESSLNAAGYHICTDNTHVYVLRVASPRVCKLLCSDLSTVTTWGASGTGDGQLGLDARGIATDGTHVYVVDQANSRLQKFTTAGTYVLQWAVPASARGCALDSAGRVLVADFANDLIKRYSSTGTLIDSFAQADPDGIAVHSDGTVWVSNTTSDNLTEWEFVVGAPVASIPPANGAFNVPQSIDIKSSSGRTYVVDTGNHRVQYFTSSGAYEGKFGSSAYSAVSGAITAGSGNGEMSSPNGIAVNQTTGDVYVVDAGNVRVQQFTATGTFTRTLGTSGTGDGQFQSPTAIAIHPTTNNVFVTDQTRDIIQEFTNTGVFVRAISGPGTANGLLSLPSGIAFDSTGDALYVSDLTDERIQKFAYSSSVVGQTLPALYAWTGIGWYGKWKGSTVGVSPNWMHVCSTTAEYTLLFGLDDGYCYRTKLRRYFHNARRGFVALEDEFEEEGEIVTAKFDAAMLGNWKLASHMVCFMENATADEYITIEYQTDQESSWVMLGTVNTTEKTYLPFGLDAATGFSTGKSFNWIQFRIRGYRGENPAFTPLIKSLVFAYLKIPQNSDAFSFVVAFPTDEYKGRTGNQIRADLNALVTSREMIRLRLHEWDDDEREFRGYLTSVSGEDAISDLVSGSRAVNFLSIRTAES